MSTTIPPSRTLTIALAGLTLLAPAAASAQAAPASAPPSAPAPSAAAPARAPDFSRVGQGWSLAEIAASGKRSWQLVSPGGVHYDLGAKSIRGELVELSGDGRRALFVDRDAWPSVRITVFDLVRRTTSSWSQRYVEHVRFTKPTGKSLHVVRLDPRGKPLSFRRTSLGGKTLTAYPLPAGGMGSVFLNSKDGRSVVVRHATSLRVRNNATGALARTIAYPKGTEGCAPVRWWSDTTLVAVCATRVAHIDTYLQLYLMSTRGAPTRQLTKGTIEASLFGYTDAWRTARGTVVERAGNCGPGGTGLLRADRATVALFPAKAGGYVVGQASSTFYLRDASCDGEGATVKRYDVTTGRVSTHTPKSARARVERIAFLDRAS